jgi:IclR family transcriptional regulator, acetate operon repressor
MTAQQLPDSDGTPGHSGLSSVDNALLLLQLVGQRRLVRIAEAADELNLARSTVHRLFAALRRRDFVTQDRPNGAYRPGRALYEAGMATIGRIDVRRVARPVMEQLRDSARETVSLLVLQGTDTRIVDDVEGTQSVRIGSRIGRVMPAHCTAGGKAILAALPAEDLRRRYGGEPLRGETPSSITDWDLLEQELAEVRRHGYGLNFGEGEVGVSAIGAVILDPLDVPLAAIAIVVPSSRLSTPRDASLLAPLLLRAQSTISDQILTGL